MMQLLMILFSCQMFYYSDDEVRELYKMITDTDSDYEALSSFLKYDPTLYKSKYIKNFLTANDVNLLK